MNELPDLLEDLERDARARSTALENQLRLPFGFTERHYPLTPAEQRELNDHKHAIAGAGDADTYLALLEGRTVDPSRLLPLHVELVNDHRRQMNTS